MAPKITEWMQPLQLLLFLDEGDLVEFKRGLFKHWGVYVGDGHVIHVQPLSAALRTSTDLAVAHKEVTIGGTIASAVGGSLLCASSTRNPTAAPTLSSAIELGWEQLYNGVEVAAVQENISDAAGDSLCRINNSNDQCWTAYEREEVIRRAKSRKGIRFNYGTFSNNCEHFANWCRYAQDLSEQSNLVVGAIAGIAFAVARYYFFRR